MANVSTHATAEASGAGREPRRDALRNHQVLARAAIRLIHRAGPGVPLARIADEAGVGIATLYRHFPSREHLLGHLTHRSFEMVLANARTAEEQGDDAVDALRRFVEAAIDQRDELVLPLHGGPPLPGPETRALQGEVRRILTRIIERGVSEGSMRDDVTAYDIVVLGAMLAQPRPDDPAWDTTARRVLTLYLRGLAAPGAVGC